MERMERVKRYMEILDQYDEGNNSYNWSILDTLSDDDLYNKEKIVEKINIYAATIKTWIKSIYEVDLK